MQGHKTSSSVTLNFVFQNKEIEMDVKKIDLAKQVIKLLTVYD